MPQILIIESDPQELICRAIERGLKPSHVMFEEAIALHSNDVNTVIRAPYDEEFDAGILHDVDGVILTGSSVNWSVDDELARPLQLAGHAIFNSGLPVFGSCNGMQLAAYILGGESGVSANGFEQGVARDVRLTDAGRTHPMMAGRPNKFSVPCMHRDEVTHAPVGALILAENDHSAVQAMVIEAKGVNFWGTQYHPEFRFDYVGQVMASDHGIFSDEEGLAEGLKGGDPTGIEDRDHDPKNRSIEIGNWLAHVGVGKPRKNKPPRVPIAGLLA